MLTKSTQQAVMNTDDRQKQEAIDLAMERNEQVRSEGNGHFLMGGSPRYQNMESIPYEIKMLYWQFEELAKLFSLDNELPDPEDVRETHFFLDTSSRVNYRYVKSMLKFTQSFIEKASTPRYANALFNRHYALRLKLSIDCWHDNFNAMFEPAQIQVAERIEELGTVSDIDALIWAIDFPIYGEARVYAKAILVYAATFAKRDIFCQQLLCRMMPSNWLNHLTLSQLLKYIRTESNLTVKSLTVNYQFGEEVQDKSKEKIVKLYRDIERGKANQEDISDEFLSYLSKTLKIPCYVLHELRSKIEKPVYEETLGYSLKKARLDCGLSMRGACKKLQEQQDQEKTFLKERWIEKKLHDARIRIKENVKDNMVQELKNKELYGLYESHIDIARDYMDELCDIQFNNMSLSGGLEAEELIFRCTCQTLVLEEMDKYVPHLTTPEDIKPAFPKHVTNKASINFHI